MSFNKEDALIKMPMSDPEPDQPSNHGSETTPVRKPVVIGIYGLPGSGKTTLMGQLKQELGEEQFTFYEGQVIAGPSTQSFLFTISQERIADWDVYVALR